MKIPVKTLREMKKQLGAQALAMTQQGSAVIERRLQKRVHHILEKDLHVKDGVKALAKEFDELGLTPNHKAHLETLYRTQTHLAYAAGREIEEMDPDIDEILWGYKYVTVGDDRVRASHAGMDGVTLPKDDSFWTTNKPPNGWNCRCQTILLFDPPEGGSIRPPDLFEGVKPEADKGFGFRASNIFKLSSPDSVLTSGVQAPPIPSKVIADVQAKVVEKRVVETQAELIERIKRQMNAPSKGDPYWKKPIKKEVPKKEVPKRTSFWKESPKKEVPEVVPREKVSTLVEPKKTVENAVDLRGTKAGEAIQDFTEESYRGVRDVQLGRTGTMSAAEVSRYQAISDQMLEGYKSVRKKHTGMVYRGLSVDEKDVKIWSKVGNTVTQEAWTSTTKDLNFAREFVVDPFVKKQKDFRVTLHIKTKNTGLDITDITPFKVHEQEVLLPKGFKWKITDVKKTGNTVEVFGEQIGGTSSAAT